VSDDGAVPSAGPSAARAAAPLLAIENLTKSFGGVTAVRGCTFTVAEGAVVGLIGPNGAGKSTVVDLVSGFGRPDGGLIAFDGRQIAGPGRWRRVRTMRPNRIARLGVVRTFQTPREWPQLTVLQNVVLAQCAFRHESLWRTLTSARRIRRKDAADQALGREILDRYQLGELADVRAGTLSGGQKRLLEFARIAAAGPRLVILDEPMGGVNPVLGARIGAAIRQLAAAGHTVVVVEHNLPFIERTCDEVIVMDVGEVIAQGPFDELRGNPRVVDAYLGMDLSHD
jgi:ABC-type branched-subunit amino acid transport system ATPase component